MYTSRNKALDIVGRESCAGVAAGNGSILISILGVGHPLRRAHAWFQGGIGTGHS